MFKSPLMKNKKGSINFIKNVASSKNIKINQGSSAKNIGQQRSLSIQKFRRQNSVLSLDISYQKGGIIRLNFAYDQETPVRDLIQFVNRQVGGGMIYFKTRDFNVDYFLCLTNRKVSELKMRKLELNVFRVRIMKSGNMLNNFELIKCVGTGGFSRVYLARGFGQIVALKVIGKKFILENQKRNIVQNQRTILQKCGDHPFVTKLYSSFETENYLIFCMEYCNGGELFNLLRKVKRMNEAQAKFYFLETLSAISFLHSQKILYRDLKPQNIIIDDEGHIRLADYGLSKIMNDEMTHSFCGSAQYMAPEMLLKKGHSYEIDYYCLGALLYQLVVGLPPYYSRNQNQLFSNIINKSLQFPQNLEISKELRSFLGKALQKDRNQRFGDIQQILRHEWLNDVNMEQVFKKKNQPPFKTNMFQTNFDDSDFANDQQRQLNLIEKQKGKNLKKIYFQDFEYICQDFLSIQKQVEKFDEKKMDFSKKPALSILQHHQSQKDISWRNNSIKNTDGIGMGEKVFNQSPRYMPVSNQNNQSNIANATYHSRSSDKLKMLMGQGNSTPQHSGLSSQISNYSNKRSEILNTSGGRYVPIKSPYLQKNNSFTKQQRLPSPININNYINIYTNKSPRQLNETNSKKTIGYINSTSSFQRINHNPILRGGSGNNSLERVKFSSLDKPMGSSSSSFLRNNVYFQSNNLSPAQRGYLSNFKERFNPNAKIKKSYKNSDKFNFNFFNSTAPLKH